MHLLILATHKTDVEIGKVYNNQGLYNYGGQWVEGVTFKIIRESNREEYLAQSGLINPRPHDSGLKYYAVSTD